MISECESLSNTTFKPDWLEYAIPFENGKPMQCKRYKSLYDSIESLGNTCSKDYFNSSEIESCNEVIVKNNEERAVSWVINLGMKLEISLKN